MRVNTKAESFVGIVVGVFILSFVMLGIINILIFSTDLTVKYNDNNRTQVLKQNISNAVKNTDTSLLQEKEVFYVYKNIATKEYEIFTGATNERYKYINEQGEFIADINSYDGDIYSQTLWVDTEDITFLEENQIIRASIKKLVKVN
ncbi:hypothetical protein GW846_03890 [Candidatus Gracilibacteria bacterium]|nr:hypothetical protein [Candidatus Gracilibacteria bacterium]